MFSPAPNAAPSASVRSSRRRQRPLSNEGSISQPNAKRQRSMMSAKTFMPPGAEGSPEMEETKNTRIATLPRHEISRDIPLQRDIVVRGRKVRTGDQGNKGDGSIVLTTNDTYTVSKLPALPDRLRADITGRQHGAIDSESGYALALTHTHAMVWPYTANMSSPETFTFALPSPSKHVSDPLPLGCLVSASASSSDPGLVVVVPTTGRITYWESISSAATLDLRLQRSGVELTIPGILSGESVIQILNAESAGFILGFSTGRIAYMSVRDGQGRPTISVHFLRGTGGAGNGGLFGSLRNALSASAWRGDIAAIRAGRPDKVGERDIVVATSKGRIQAWNVHRGGHTSITAEADGREAIVMAIKRTVPFLSDLHLECFELLDFAYTPKSQAGSQLINSEDKGVHLLLIVSLKARDVTHYSLVEITLNNNSELEIGIVRPIKSYTTPIERNSISKARLFLPNPALVSYLVFDRAVVVVSMARPLESPDNQLRLEGHLAPKAFEDVIDFREELNVEIVGSGMEEPSAQMQGNEEMKSRRHRPKHPATVLFVRGGGVVRVAATDTPRLLSNKPQQVTARSKLEQAVFFGTLEQNPLSFSVRSELQFPAEEVGAAALDLSLDILKSNIPYIPSVPASIDQNLRKRAKALLDLAKYIKTSGIKLDRATKWKLLADAEKMAAATTIWRQYDTRLREKPVGQKRGLLTELVEFIHEDYKTEPVAEAGELDRVRHWFIKDIWNLEIAVPWAYQVIKYTYQDGQKDHRSVFEIVSEANDMVIGSLMGAFDFRNSNLELYGLGNEELEHGILKLGYEGLPEFWTSSQFITENARKQCELAGLLVKEYWEQPLGGPGKPMPEVVDKVRHEHPILIDVSIRANNERIRWAAAQELPQAQMQAEQLQKQQVMAEDDQLSLLVTDLNLSDEAINLAEKHEILPILAQITSHEVNAITKEIAAAVALDQDVAFSWTNRAIQLRSRVRSFFEKFGSRWASAFYEHLISTGSTEELFDAYPEQQEYLTAFLRSQPQYAKLSWIQEVTRERDFDAAAKTLLDLGLQREQDLWSQKIELSMGKLARLAGRSYSESNGIIVPDGQKLDVVPTDNKLALIKIQNIVYDYVLDSIEPAVDTAAEIQLAIEAHGNTDLKNQHRLVSFLEDGMSRLMKHESMEALTLIDLLTLMKSVEQDYNFQSVQFYFALDACRRGVNNKDEQTLVQRIIWRRCMLRDRWDEVNDTDLKNDSEVSERLRTTSLYLTFRACLQKRLFDVPSNIKPFSPEDVLGAGTEELDHRFRGLDASIRESIMNDMQVEDDQLKPYIRTSRLDKWYQGTLDLARQDYEEGIAEQTNAGLRTKQAEERLAQIEQDIAEKERQGASKRLHSKSKFKPKARLLLNGSTNLRGSIMQY